MIAPVSIVDILDTQTSTSVPLLMQHVHLSGEITPFGAGLTIRHVFRPDLAGTTELVYAFMLPRDASITGFRVVGETFRVDGELKPVKQAVEEYEAGVAEGKLSVLARTYRDGMVNLSVGQIRPGETIAVWLSLAQGVQLLTSGLRFRFPFALAPVYHPSMRFEATPDGLTAAAPEEVYGDMLLPEWKNGNEGVHTVSFALRLGTPGKLRRLESPSHAIASTTLSPDMVRVHSADGSEFPNRDLVLEAEWESVTPFAWSAHDGERVQFALHLPGSSLKAGTTVETTARRIVLLIDSSGSMEGEKMQQAIRAVHACLSGLSPDDHVGLINFSYNPVRFAPCLVRPDAYTLPALRQFADGIRADGGTQLYGALSAAGQLLKGAPGEILLITDGEVGDTSSYIRFATEAGHQVHALGIGDASQDRFLSLLSRATGGLNTMLMTNERVDLAAAEIFARGRSPLLRGLQLASNHPGLKVSPDLPKHIHEGMSLDIMGSLPAEPETRLTLTWEGAAAPVCVDIPAEKARRAGWLNALRGARLTAALESTVNHHDPVAKRTRSRELAALARAHGVANTEWAWVAVISRPGDEANGLPTTKVVPTKLPRGAEPVATADKGRRDYCYDVSRGFQSGPSMFEPMVRLNVSPSPSEVDPVPVARRKPAPPDVNETIFRLLTLVKSDGGLPGNTLEERVWATLALVDRMLRERKRTGTPAFDPQIKRLREFLRPLQAAVVNDSELRHTLIALLEPDTPPMDEKLLRKLEASWALLITNP